MQKSSPLRRRRARRGENAGGRATPRAARPSGAAPRGAAARRAAAPLRHLAQHARDNLPVSGIFIAGQARRAVAGCDARCWL